MDHRLQHFAGWLLAAGLTTVPAAKVLVVADSTRKQLPSDTLSAGARIYEYIAHPTLQLLTWPMETLVAPTVRTLTYPTQQPIRYFLNENIIDRTRRLFSIGPDNKILIYPTLSLAPGTGSRAGLTLRDRSLFGRDNERLVTSVVYYVNGDYKGRAYLTSRELLGTPFTGKVVAGLVRTKNSSVNQPGTSGFLYYSDTSEYYQAQLQYPLFLGFGVRGSLSLRQSRLSGSPTPSDTLGNFFANRGIGESFLDKAWQVGLTRDTRNNENITLTGDWLKAGWAYHDIGNSHDYKEWKAEYTTYFKLGRERYEITAAEEQRRGNMSMEKFLRKLEYEKLREEIFSRKVVALHFYAAESYEIPGNTMPVYGLQTLGNDTPLRGYTGSRFRDYTVAAVSAEYRFPVLRLMDGIFFDEYGVRGHSWDVIDYLNYKNSWGFGIRVRRPDLFLFRFDVGIHGLSGAAFNLSVNTPY